MDDIKIVGLASNKTKGKTNWKVIGAIIGIIVLSVGVIAGILLVRQQQDIREQAGGNCENPSSIVQCPRSDGALVSCNPPDSNGNAQISLCDSRFVGRPEVCGGTQYCCNGTAWVTDMTSCATCDAKAPTGLTVTNLTSNSVTLKWGTNGTGSKLRLWVSKDSDPTGTCNSTSTTCIVNDLSITPISTSEYVLTNLTPNTRYYWNLMAWTREGCDSRSPASNFTTLSTDATGSTATPTVIATSNSKTATPTMTATATSFSSKTATPTATSTSKATATTSSSKTATPTVKATSTGSATAFPVPETGADLPTVLGVSFGIVMVLVSLGLAL